MSSEETNVLQLRGRCGVEESRIPAPAKTQPRRSRTPRPCRARHPRTPPPVAAAPAAPPEPAAPPPPLVSALGGLRAASPVSAVPSMVSAVDDPVHAIPTEGPPAPPPPPLPPAPAPPLPPLHSPAHCTAQAPRLPRFLTSDRPSSDGGQRASWPVLGRYVACAPPPLRPRPRFENLSPCDGVWSCDATHVRISPRHNGDASKHAAQHGTPAIERQAVAAAGPVFPFILMRRRVCSWCGTWSGGRARRQPNG